MQGRRDLVSILSEIVRTPQPTATETANQEFVERSAMDRTPLFARYYSTHGAEGWRHISVQRVTPGPPVRFVGLCHRSNELRWFRVENVLAARLDDAERYRAAPAASVEEMLRGSLGGYSESGPARDHVFSVDAPDARWVAKNLLDGMTVETVEGGIRVRVSTSALPIVARFVAGLGASARAETDELRAAVVALAEGTLATHAAQAKRGSRRAK